MKILDQGFIRLVEHMGGDRAVVQAARVSFGQGLKTEEQDRKLVGYLLAHRHTSPFEQAVFKFHVKAPVFVARQWFRHRMASYNEISQRYKEVVDDFYIPAAWRAQSKTNKQGSKTTDDIEHAAVTRQVRHFVGRAYDLYGWMLQEGVAKEMARFVLPINIFTEFYVTLNAHALLHFIRLRSEARAQYEIRVYSDAMANILREKMPWTFEAFFKGLDKSKYPGLASEVPA